MVLVRGGDALAASVNASHVAASTTPIMYLRTLIAVPPSFQLKGPD
jgi:hypothetical protein